MATWYLCDQGIDGDIRQWLCPWCWWLCYWWCWWRWRCCYWSQWLPPRFPVGGQEFRPLSISPGNLNFDDTDILWMWHKISKDNGDDAVLRREQPPMAVFPLWLLQVWVRDQKSIRPVARFDSHIGAIGGPGHDDNDDGEGMSMIMMCLYLSIIRTTPAQQSLHLLQCSFNLMSQWSQEKKWWKSIYL